MDDHIAGTPEEAWRDNAERRYREGYLEGAIYGTANERERIIALLESELHEGFDYEGEQVQCGCDICWRRMSDIMLINREEPNA